MMQLLTGPIVRQLIQVAGAATATTGIINESDVATIVGAITSLANIAWVIYARVTAAK
ncbi:hypothetical protein UFOVP810_43 [uncultured Caudovirales phage]|uniref:Holin n=1 Tax=uncultured Caudovirales phage TaxID=2100421 RepID=A0A6J5NXG4_9CAUD|nr:hypothetical protein UFOVP568_54 [uncultured Caudovirales phage]CAB4163687.1 hypothetical protein UFOVP810_43 [uncultured Caudovirales phage]